MDDVGELICKSLACSCPLAISLATILILTFSGSKEKEKTSPKEDKKEPTSEPPAKDKKTKKKVVVADVDEKIERSEPASSSKKKPEDDEIGPFGPHGIGAEPFEEEAPPLRPSEADEPPDDAHIERRESVPQDDRVKEEGEEAKVKLEPKVEEKKEPKVKTNLPLAMRRIHDKLQSPTELLKLHLKHYQVLPIHLRTDANNLVTTAQTTHLPEQKETHHLIQMLRHERISGHIEDLAHV